jgi:uncharacterized membrane protein YeaQ/YmgE (transglycosylase-associated protein family)
MDVITWIILGLVCGAIAKAIMPGPDPGGIIVTIIIGIVGAVVGGFIGRIAFGAGVTGFNWQSVMLSVIGALLLLWIYRLATKGRAAPRVP